MPMKPAHNCKYPGCQRLEVINGLCHRHQGMGYHPDRKRRALYDHKWERASKAFLAEYPWCNDCGKIATEVHHKQKHRGDHVLFWDETNWMPLCHRCHSKRTGRGE